MICDCVVVIGDRRVFVKTLIKCASTTVAFFRRCLEVQKKNAWREEDCQNNFNVGLTMKSQATVPQFS